MFTSDTTMGAELEFAKLGTNAVTGMENWLRFHLHNDGSVRDVTYTAGSIAIYPQEDKHGNPILSLGMKPQQPYGLEVITEPYTYTEFRTIGQKIAMVFGHIPANSRCSIHVHVDQHNETWRDVQRLIIWARALEAIIYRVSCGGNVHRGSQLYNGNPNDHKFARPLSMPIGVNWSNGKTNPLIVWDRLVGANTASEFVSSWGRLDRYWSGGFEHYMPHRLHMINLSSILRLGTMEWRIFDGMYRYFDIILDFVAHIHMLSSKGELPDFSFDLGSTPNVDVDWVNKLLDMDVSPLWGENWQKGCISRHPLSHYPNQPTLYTHSDSAIQPIMNRYARDMGEETFPLFVRERS